MLVLLSVLAASLSGPAQDEIVRTAPQVVTATARQDCMYGGQPVACPQPVAVATTQAVPASAGPENTNPWNVVTSANFENTTTNEATPQAPPEGGYVRSRGIRGTASFNENAPPSTSPPRQRVFVSESLQNGTQITSPTSGDTTPPRDTPPPFDWGGLANRGPQTPNSAGEYTAEFYDGNSASQDRNAVPEWAFSDPERYELDQCGPGTSEPSGQCRRNARNRLASARAEAAIAREPVRNPAAPQTRSSACRTVTEPARDGMPAAASVVCGNGDQDALLESMRQRAAQMATPGN